ncbi:uncharacterized protein J3R85_018429 [Psidium guajava]|nr:uncharacterized protein J3R85_018429 [Psidium guajava]
MEQLLRGGGRVHFRSGRTPDLLVKLHPVVIILDFGSTPIPQTRFGLRCRRHPPKLITTTSLVGGPETALRLSVELDTGATSHRHRARLTETEQEPAEDTRE